MSSPGGGPVALLLAALMCSLAEGFIMKGLRPGGILPGPGMNIRGRAGIQVGPGMPGCGLGRTFVPRGFVSNACRTRSRWWAGVVPHAARMGEESGDELNFSSAEVSRDDAEVAEVPVSAWSKRQQEAMALQSDGGWKGSVWRTITNTEFDTAIFSLAVPALGSLIIEPGVRTLEAIMVGRLGAARLGALSIGGSVVSVSFPLFNFFSYATTPMVARALATNDTKEASRLVAQGIWLSTVVGCSLMAAMLVFCDGILLTMGANAEIFPFAKQFMMIRALAAPAELWLLVAKGASYGHQNTRAPLTAIAAGSAVHIALDTLLILGFHMDLAGAAISVVISQYITSLYLLTMLVKDGILQLPDLVMLPDVSKIFDYLTAGSQLLIRTISMQTFYTVMTSYGARMGTAVIAAHAIARQCASLEALIVDGLAVATQALVAMYIGQNQRETARRLCSRLLFLGAVAGSLLGFLLFMCSAPIASAFTSDVRVIKEATRALPLVAAVQLPAALAYIYDGIFLGARDFKFLGVAMFFCTIPAMLTLITLAHFFDLGLVTLWLASGTLIVSRVIALSWRYASPKGPFHRHEVNDAKPLPSSS